MQVLIYAYHSFYAFYLSWQQSIRNIDHVYNQGFIWMSWTFDNFVLNQKIYNIDSWLYYSLCYDYLSLLLNIIIINCHMKGNNFQFCSDSTPSIKWALYKPMILLRTNSDNTGDTKSLVTMLLILCWCHHRIFLALTVPVPAAT